MKINIYLLKSSEIKSDPRWIKSTELEIQNRALFGEVQREKIERLNYIQQKYRKNKIIFFVSII
jgi:hypothetical protein